MKTDSKKFPEVKKAVIPAAGLGTRFLPITKAMPKEMLPIVDKPAIQYIVEEAVASGITDILIITGRGKRAIEDHFDRNTELNELLRAKGKNAELNELEKIEDMADIHYVRQKEALGLGHAVLCAEKHIGDEPFAVMLGDDLVMGKEPCLKRLIEIYSKHNAGVVAVEALPMELVSKYGIVKGKNYLDTFLVEGVVEKPSQEKAPSNLAILGRYVLKPGIFGILKQTPYGKGNELQLTDALNSLCRQEKFLAHKIEGKWYTVGDKLEYLKTILAFASQRKDLGSEFRDYARKFLGSGAK